MNKLIISIVMMIILSMSVLAIMPIGSIFDSTDGRTIQITDSDYDLTRSELILSEISQLDSSTDPIIFSREDKVGNYFCSDTGTIKDFIATSKSICLTVNLNGGVVWDMFVFNPWDKVGRLKIEKGSKECFTITPGVKYRTVQYACNDLDIPECLESDSGIDYNTRGYVNVISSGKTSIWYDECDDFGNLNERYCDEFNTVATNNYECPNICKNGECVDNIVGAGDSAIIGADIGTDIGTNGDTPIDSGEGDVEPDPEVKSIIEYTVTKFEYNAIEQYVKAFITIKNTGDQNANGLISLELMTQKEIDEAYAAQRTGIDSDVTYKNCALLEDAQAYINLRANQNKEIELSSILQPDQEYVDILIMAPPECWKDVPTDKEGIIYENYGGSAWYNTDDNSKLIDAIETSNSIKASTQINLPLNTLGVSGFCEWPEGYPHKWYAKSPIQGYTLCYNNEKISCSCNAGSIIDLSPDCSFINTGCQDGLICNDLNKNGGAWCEPESYGFCGDGQLNIGEECDDGNIIDGDGCSKECLIEDQDSFKVKKATLSEDKSQWCIENGECYPRKDLILLSELINLDQLTIWEKSSESYFNDEVNPLCLNQYGNNQCKDGGICLAAKDSALSINKDRKLVYDALKPVVTTNFEKFKGFTSLDLLGFAWLLDINTQQKNIEKFGVCVPEERDIFSKIKGWISDQFNLDIDDPIVLMILFGVIFLIIMFIMKLSNPQ